MVGVWLIQPPYLCHPEHGAKASSNPGRNLQLKECNSSELSDNHPIPCTLLRHLGVVAIGYHHVYLLAPTPFVHLNNELVLIDYQNRPRCLASIDNCDELIFPVVERTGRRPFAPEQNKEQEAFHDRDASRPQRMDLQRVNGTTIAKIREWWRWAERLLVRHLGGLRFVLGTCHSVMQEACCPPTGTSYK